MIRGLTVDQLDNTNMFKENAHGGGKHEKADNKSTVNNVVTEWKIDV